MVWWCLLSRYDFFLGHTSEIKSDSHVIRPEWISLTFQADHLYNAGNRLLRTSFCLHRRVFVRKTFSFDFNMALMEHVKIDLFFPACC